MHIGTIQHTCGLEQRVFNYIIFRYEINLRKTLRVSIFKEIKLSCAAKTLNDVVNLIHKKKKKFLEA